MNYICFDPNYFIQPFSAALLRANEKISEVPR